MDDEFLDHLRGQGKLAYHRVTQYQVAVAEKGCAAAAIFFLQCYYKAFDKSSARDLENLVESEGWMEYAENEAKIIGPSHQVLYKIAGPVRCEDALRTAMVNGAGGTIQYSIFATKEDAKKAQQDGTDKDGNYASGVPVAGHVFAYVTDPFSKHKLIIFDPNQQKGITDFEKPDGVAIAAERSYEQGTFFKIDPIKDKWTANALIDLVSRDITTRVLECITSCGPAEDRSGDPLPEPSFYTAASRRLLSYKKPSGTKIKPDEVELVGVEWIKEYRESPKEINKSIAHIPKSRPFHLKSSELPPSLAWPKEDVKKYKELQKERRAEREDGPIVPKRKRLLQEEPAVKEVPLEPQAKKARVRKLVKYSDKPLHPLEVGRGRGTGPSPFSPLGEQVANYALSEDDIRSVVGNIPIYRYPAIDNMKSPDEMFKGHKATVLLFLTDDKDTGHWLTVLDHPDHYEVFDSFGVGA